MSVHLTQQAQALLGKSARVIVTARVDDVALLIGQMVKMGCVEVLDKPRPQHWTQRGVSWGWTAVLWLAYILTEGEHRKVSVEAYSKSLHTTLSHLSGQRIEPRDCSDDRWGHLLTHVSTPTYGHAIEQDLHACSLEVDDLSQDVIRWDATTVAGTHHGTDGGLVPCGHRTAEPTRPQLKVMMGSLDPFGRPLATAVWSGERADDGVDMPRMERSEARLNRSARLCVGDGQRSAWATRAHVAGCQPCYRSPWPLTGATAEAMAEGLSEGLAQDRDGELEPIVRVKHRGEPVLAAEGDEVESACCLDAGAATWNDRVLVGRSPVHAERQPAGLETRLAHAEHKLAALRPARGRGTRQLRAEATRVEAIDHGLKAPRVDG